MRSTLGCLTVASAAAALSVSNGLEAPLAVGALSATFSAVGGSEAKAQPPPTPSCYGTTIASMSYLDTVSLYGADCAVGSPTVTYGTLGVCLASIKAAVTCAVNSLNSSAGSTLATTLTVGNGSATSPFVADLTQDKSLASTTSFYPTTPTFDIANLLSPYPSASCTSTTRAGCLTISGTNNPALTVITTATGQHEVQIRSGSHILFSGMTFRMPMELMDQGTYVSTGLTTITLGSTTLTFPTITINVIPQTNSPQIQNPSSFAALTPASHAISFASSPNPILVDISSGGACSADATIALGIIGGTATVQSIVSPAAGCASGYPNTTQTVYAPTACGSISGVSACASFYVAYTATPMAQWISNLNSNYANGKPQFESDLKAYTIPHGTSVASTANSMGGSVIVNLAYWGAVHFSPGNIFLPLLPSQISGSPNEWTLTLDKPSPAVGQVPPYFEDPRNYVCSHVDDSTAAYISNANAATNSNGGSDIIFNHVVWVNTARLEIQGTPFTQVANSSINRDTLAYASQTITSGSITASVIPCYGSVNGGPQFSQPDGPATYGNTVNNFSAEATADDSLAFYNDVGGYTLSSSYTTICQSTICPQSNVLSSTIKDAAVHPIRLRNNNSITGIPDVASGTLDSGSCTSSMLGTFGSPVCVDADTTSFITMSVANCDTYALGTLACPILFDFGN